MCMLQQAIKVTPLTLINQPNKYVLQCKMVIGVPHALAHRAQGKDDQ